MFNKLIALPRWSFYFYSSLFSRVYGYLRHFSQSLQNRILRNRRANLWNIRGPKNDGSRAYAQDIILNPAADRLFVSM